MGSCNSGWRRDAKSLVEDCRQIDINRFARDRYLHGSSFTWCWYSSKGEKRASITIRPQSDGIRLGYIFTRNGQKHDMDYIVPVEYVPVGYGERPYFLCPVCGTRCLKLYLNSNYFTCRSCANINYESTRERYADRMMNRARNIRRRIGASMSMADSISPYDKPKRMRWYTFNRLKAQAEFFEVRGWGVIARELGLLDENGRRQ